MRSVTVPLMAVEMTFGFQESVRSAALDHGQSIGPELKNPLATAREPIDAAKRRRYSERGSSVRRCYLRLTRDSNVEHRAPLNLLTSRTDRFIASIDIVRASHFAA